MKGNAFKPNVKIAGRAYSKEDKKAIITRIKMAWLGVHVSFGKMLFISTDNLFYIEDSLLCQMMERAAQAFNNEGRIDAGSSTFQQKNDYLSRLLQAWQMTNDLRLGQLCWNSLPLDTDICLISDQEMINHVEQFICKHKLGN